MNCVLAVAEKNLKNAVLEKEYSISLISFREQINRQNGSRYVTENRHKEMTYFSFPRAMWRRLFFCPN